MDKKKAIHTGRQGTIDDSPAGIFFCDPGHSHFLRVLDIKKYLLDSKAKVAGLPQLCGKNISESGHRDSELGFLTPF
jgi:hypothetical protein